MVISKFQRFKRILIKRFIYAMLSFREAIMIILGRSKPIVIFTVEGTPPSVYYNFRIRPDRVDALAQKLDLPPGFTLAKMRFLEGDPEPDYFVTLNIYRVSGITNGLRAEWSIYVQDPQGKPRYMVAEACTSQHSMDPVDIITRAGKMTHELKEDRVETYVESDHGTLFRASCPLPTDPNAPTGLAAREWIEANDHIYWLNGVIDRTLYDGKMVNAKIRVIPPESLTLEDTTSWQDYIEPMPFRTLVFPDAIEFVISPWWNL